MHIPSMRLSAAKSSFLRVFMAFKPLNKPVAVPEQTLSAFERVGFTAVEWGGAEVG